MKSPPLDVALLVREHQAGLWRYLRYLGCAPVEAEDLVQETFLSVLRRPFEDQGPAATAGYLRTAARHFFLKHRERGARAVQLGERELERAEETWSRAAGDDGGDGYLAALRRCLGSLDGRTRRALDLQYRDGASRSGIGAALELSDDGVKSLVRRARATLRACIERSLSR